MVYCVPPIYGHVYGENVDNPLGSSVPMGALFFKQTIVDHIRMVFENVMLRLESFLTNCKRLTGMD